MSFKGEKDLIIEELCTPKGRRRVIFQILGIGTITVLITNGLISCGNKEATCDQIAEGQDPDKGKYINRITNPDKNGPRIGYWSQRVDLLETPFDQRDDEWAQAVVDRCKFATKKEITVEDVRNALGVPNKVNPEIGVE